MSKYDIIIPYCNNNILFHFILFTHFREKEIKGQYESERE